MAENAIGNGIALLQTLATNKDPINRAAAQVLLESANGDNLDQAQRQLDRAGEIALKADKAARALPGYKQDDPLSKALADSSKEMLAAVARRAARLADKQPDF